MKISLIKRDYKNKMTKKKNSGQSTFFSKSIYALFLIFFVLQSYQLLAQDYDFSASDVSGCSPLKIIFKNLTKDSLINNHTYEWTVEQGKYSTQADSVQNTYINPGTYTVTMKVYDKNKKLVETISKENYITVFRDPDVTITSDIQSTCENQPFQFSIESIDSDAEIVSYTWVLSDGSSYLTEEIPPYVFGRADDFTVFLSITNANGCSNRERKPITVKTYNDYPAVSFMASKTRVCEPQLTVTFTNQTEEENVVSYHWDLGDGTEFDGKTPPSHTYTGYGNYMPTLTATAKSGCTSTSARRIQLIDFQPNIIIKDEYPQVTFNQTEIKRNIHTANPYSTQSANPTKSAYCPGKITFSDANASQDIAWDWDYLNDGSIESDLNDFTIDIPQAGTYTIKLTANNGTCEKDVVRTFSVEEPLTINASPTEDFYCSLPATISYKATSNVANTNFYWAISDTTFYTDASFNKTLIHDGFYSAHLYAISPNYCTSDIALPNNVEITIPKLTNGNKSTYASPRSGCVPLDVTFTAFYEYNTDRDSIAVISWDYNEDGSVDDYSYFNKKEKSGYLTKSHTYDQEGVFSYLFTLETSKGCRYNNLYRHNYSLSPEPGVYDSVSVGHKPNISIDFDNVICASDELIISVTFDDKNRYQSRYDTIEVNFIENSNPYSIHAIFDSENPIPSSFSVIFNDTIGFHKASLYTSDNGCSQTKYLDEGVLVKGPLIDLVSSESSCDTPFNYRYSLRKNYGSENWDWYLRRAENSAWTKIASNLDSIDVDFRDYGGRGTYWIKVTATNATTGCQMSDSLMTNVTNIVGAIALEDYEPCYGDKANFLIDPTMGQDIQSWKWVYDWHGVHESRLIATYSADLDLLYRYDTRDSAKRYVFNYEDIDFVMVVTQDMHNCSDTIKVPVKVIKPQAGFYGDVLSDCLPFVTNFTDTSKSEFPIVKRTWNLGNGTILSGSETTIHTEYSDKGSKKVSLIVTDEQGCADTAAVSDYIKPVVPNSDFHVKKEKVCLGKEAEFVRNLDTYGYANTLSKYLWDFGDNTTDSQNGDLQKTTIHTYSEANNTPYEVKLVAYCISPEGHECIDSSTQEIDIKNVGANIKIKDSDQCKEPGQKFIVYIDNSIYNNYIRSYAWWKIDGGDSIYVSNKRNMQVVTFDTFGDQSLSLNTKSEYWGCEDTTFTIPVHVPGYEANLMADKTEVCIHEDVTFSVFDTLNLYRYDCYWEFGDGKSVEFTDTSIQHQYTALAGNDGNLYKVQFFVDAPGCKTRDISVDITTFPVIAMFTRGTEDLDTADCAPYTVKLFNTSVAGKDASYLWDLGDGRTSTEINPTITIDNPNTIIPVSLSVTSNICNDTIRKNVQTYPLADVTFALDTSICVGEKISAVATGDFTSIVWKPVELFTNSRNAKTDINISQSQNIYVETKNGYNCNRIDTIPIFVQQKPYYWGAPDYEIVYYAADGSPVVGNTNTHTLIAGESYNVNTREIPGVSYSWTPSSFLSCSDCPSPDIDLQCGDGALYDCMDFPESLDYTIYMQDSLGCFTNDTTIHFNVGFDSKIALPEAFTPNGDGINDVALVQGWGIKEFLEVKIYNRWGQVVFESDNMATGWDGTFKGEPQGMDTYSYKIKAISIRNEEMFEKGYITLIR